MVGRVLIVMALAAVPVTVAAQPDPCGPMPAAPVLVTGNTSLCFSASADHAKKLPDGRDVVTGYEWGNQLPGAPAPFQRFSLGKPAPGADGAIRTKPPELMSITLNTLYEARVVAVGPTGEGVSDPSNPFFRSGPPASSGRPVVGGGS